MAKLSVPKREFSRYPALGRRRSRKRNKYSDNLIVRRRTK